MISIKYTKFFTLKFINKIFKHGSKIKTIVAVYKYIVNIKYKIYNKIEVLTSKNT